MAVLPRRAPPALSDERPWLECLIGRDATTYSRGVRWFVGCMKPATLVGEMQGWRGSWRLSPCEALYPWQQAAGRPRGHGMLCRSSRAASGASAEATCETQLKPARLATYESLDQIDIVAMSHQLIYRVKLRSSSSFAWYLGDAFRLDDQLRFVGIPQGLSLWICGYIQ